MDIVQGDTTLQELQSILQIEIDFSKVIDQATVFSATRGNLSMALRSSAVIPSEIFSTTLGQVHLSY